MADNQRPAGVLPDAGTGTTATTERATLRPSPAARLLARLNAREYDRRLAVGVKPTPASALAAHEWRLTSRAEREAIARSLRQALVDAQGGGRLLSARVPLNIPNILAAEELIDAITLRLHSLRPVHARGTARLRLLLSDGTGPLYRYGRGDLRGRLGAALAAL
ncbi:hypothetical protein [Mycolicibacterium sp. XJ1819]